jgi:hypothetical protein
MLRSVVGLLTAFGAIMLALAPYAHGVFSGVMIADGGAVAGLAAYLAVVPKKKILRLDSSQANPS